MTFKNDATSVSVDSNDNVYVFSRGPIPVMIFNSEGEFIKSWGKGEFFRPHGIAHDNKDNVYLIDDQGHMVEKRNKDGKLLFRLGNKGKSSPHQSGKIFNLPTDAVIDPDNGDILWKNSVNSPVRAAPIADNSMVFVLSVDNKINSFDIQSGEKRWEYTWFSDTAGLVQTSNMALFGDNIIVPYKSGEVFVFNRNNGNRLWADSVNRKNIKNSLSQIKDITASPIVHEDILITVGFQGRLIANNVKNGFRAWELPISSSITPIASNGYLFIISNENILFAINIDTGDVLWLEDIKVGYEFKNDNKIISMQLLQGSLYIFLSSGDLIIYDPKTGILNDILQNKIEATSIAPIVVNKNLYVISSDGELISYR